MNTSTYTLKNDLKNKIFLEKKVPKLSDLMTIIWSKVRGTVWGNKDAKNS